MKIFIGADHAGYELKQALLPWLELLGHEVEDTGASVFDEDDDYPDFIAPAVIAVSTKKRGEGPVRAIVIGGSGQGEAMLANRFPGVRAAVYFGGNLEIIRLSRDHNDANTLALGARFLDEDEAKVAVLLWLKTPFSGDQRHRRRLEKMEKAPERVLKN